ncbi:solute carrier family 2, facilitated glucose transporter member 1-like [Chironomus tepperi]|uniref:solute carrier family 2, facilitated glucose transporter member 1-like n=1 Tax=Chironomus tepperi TaxID=113505 RepID=UPI00391F3F18
MDRHDEEYGSALKQDKSPYRNTLHKRTRGWNKALFITGLATTFGSAVVGGYNIGVINAPSSYMQAWANETLYTKYGIQLSSGGIDLLWSFIVSIFLVGGAVGSLGGSYVANRIGRKRSYLTCATLFTIGSVCFHICRFLSSVELLILGRMLVGLGAGMTMTCLPMYLSEIAPFHLRGTLGVFCSMGFTGGVVVGQVVSLQEVLGTSDLWHYSMSFQLIFVILCTLAYPIFPESPKYLCLIGDRSGALRELKKLCDNNEMAEDELNSMEMLTDNTEEEEGSSQKGLLDVLKDPKFLLPLVLVCALQGGQQLSGINAVFFYSVSIFESIGFSKSNAGWANLGAGCLNLCVSFFSPLLMARVNRRPLIMLSCFGCGVFLFLLSIFYGYSDSYSSFPMLCVVALLGYILLYQIGLGPVPYFIGVELFETAERSSAMALGSLSSWVCNFLIGMCFTSLRTWLGAAVFVIFGVVCILLTLLLKVYMPETRGKDTSDIVNLVSRGFQSRPVERKDKMLNRINNELSS